MEADAVTVSDGVEFEISMKGPDLLEEEPEHAEQGK